MRIVACVMASLQTDQDIRTLVVWGLLIGVPVAVVFYLRKKNEGRPLGMPNMTTPPEFSKDAGPGAFEVVGVDRSSKMDTTWHCRADSADNAKAKGELEGIVVTRVRRTGP